MKIVIVQLKKFGLIFVRAFIDTAKHDGIEHAGYLSFLLMLSFFPFLVFLVAIIGSITSLMDVEIIATLINIILESSWANFITALKPRIIEITSAPPQNFLTLAILSAIWTASSLFEALRTILNRAYRVKAPPTYIMRRIFSIIEFATMITIIIALMFLLVVIPSIWNVVSGYLPTEKWLLIAIIEKKSEYLRLLILIIIGFLFVSYLYYFLPNKKQTLYKTYPGTIAVLICWAIFSMAFKYYITFFPQINIIYGSIAGVIVSLLYFYFCSIIFIYGAELNYHFESYIISKKITYKKTAK